jgi:hypothetical protein
MEIDVRAHSAASADEVYALLAAGTTWPTWSPIDSFELERPGERGGQDGDGDASREGLQAIRVFRTGRLVSRERIVELVPGRRLSYALLSGLPLRDYRADVDLTPDADGTAIRWHSRFRAKVPGTGWLYRRGLRRFIQRCADGLAAYAAAEGRR